jgi:hypothetical protein
MLSPHELATLMVLHSAPDQIDTTRAELDTLLDSHLVSLVPGAAGWRGLSLTPKGEHVLQLAARR